MLHGAKRRSEIRGSQDEGRAQHDHLVWPRSVQRYSASNTATLRWLENLNLEQFVYDCLELSLSKSEQLITVFQKLHRVVQQAPVRPLNEGSSQWGSDGTMLKSGPHSATASWAGTRAIQVRLHNPQTNSLHGEIVGQFLAVTDSLTGPPTIPTIHTDCLHSISRLADGSGTRTDRAGHHYCSWYEHLAQLSPTQINLQHVNSHTATLALPQRLNDECDRLAKAAHQTAPLLPDPICFLPKFTLCFGLAGHVDSDIETALRQPLADKRLSNLREPRQERLLGAPGLDRSPRDFYSARKSIYSWSLQCQIL